MIRKFGYDDIYRFAGEGDEKKVLVGIRRKKERAKKKRAGGDGEEGGEEVCRSSFLSFSFISLSFPSTLWSISCSLIFALVISWKAKIGTKLTLP